MASDLSHSVVRPASDAKGFATCPLCHTADSIVTNVAVSGGGEWHCAKCGQSWDARRLEAVGNYEVWLADRTRTVISR
jgi:transcription elongation factor Elf1